MTLHRFTATAPRDGTAGEARWGSCARNADSTRFAVHEKRSVVALATAGVRACANRRHDVGLRQSDERGAEARANRFA